MRRLPLWPTLFVALAVATMVALGVWQVQRAGWKDALIQRYAASATLPPIAFPAVPTRDETLLFRRAEGYCLEATGWSARAGRNLAGEPGWRHVALCRRGAEGPGIAVDYGWSKSAEAPKGRIGGPVAGVLDYDRDHIFLLVAREPAPGLEASMPPSPAAIPNNHRAYAVQWFAFAAIALVIYALALRRMRG